MFVHPRPISSSARPPHVAVVVPCYNYGRFLGDCVESLVDQPGVTTEILIIDDCSTDDSFEVAERLAERFPQVRAVRHPQNRGHIATYNEGLSAADSDYVVLLSADDMLAPGSLARATALMEARPSVGLVYGNPQAFTDIPDRATSAPVRNWSVWSGSRWIEAQFKRSLSIIHNPEAIVRTSVHHAAGYYRPELPYSGDLEMWLRIAAVSDVGRVNGPDQAYRRVHAESMMSADPHPLLKDLTERERAYSRFLDDHASVVRDATRLRGIMQRRLATEALSWASTVGTDPRINRAEVMEMVRFAYAVHPEVEQLDAWHEYITIHDPRAVQVRDRLAARRAALARAVGDRVRWRRWRRYGF